MDSEDGELFIKQLANFVRTHEKALANAANNRRQHGPRHGASQSVSSISASALVTSPITPDRPSTSATPSASASASSLAAAALSLGSLSLSSNAVKSAKLALTPHHLFYLLSRFEELGIEVGPMKIRLENLHDSSSSANYVSFLSQRSKSRGSDVGSIRSVSSVRSVMSGMSALWASIGLGSGISAARMEKQKAAIQADLKYLYSAFTKIPCLKLAPDWRARLIRGYEEFPFDSAVPLHVFKNVHVLEVCDMDFRQFFGWDWMAEKLKSLSLRRAGVDDPADILIDIVLDDMDKRRRRSSKAQASPSTPWGGASSPKRNSYVQPTDTYRTTTALMPGSPDARRSTGDLLLGSLNSGLGVPIEHERPNIRELRRPSLAVGDMTMARSPAKQPPRPRSHSPRRPASSRNGSAALPRGGSYKVRRSGSGSSQSSLSDSWQRGRSGSSSNLLTMGILPLSKWRLLQHLSLADNSLTSILATSLAPLAKPLRSLDLSSNLFTQIPDSLATLTSLRALNLSQCMIDSLHSLTRNPLPAITVLNLRANRLQSLAGIEKLYPLERLDLRDNRLTDPMELARLTGIPYIREIWVEGNPFTRTHRDYRVTIFNLFRQTPGFTEDIVIDGTGPSYSEKRQLVDRVAEPPAVPVIRQPIPEMPAVDVSRPTIIYDEPSTRNEESTLERSDLKAATMGEANTSSSRRRRAPKRRIVDLATSDQPLPHAQPVTGNASHRDRLEPMSPESHYSTTSHEPQMQGTSKMTAGARRGSGSKSGAVVIPSAVTSLAESPIPKSQVPPHVPRIDTSVVPQLPPLYMSPESQTVDDEWKDRASWDAGGELYRRKIEALRDKIGNGYLSVLSEEGWDGTKPPPHFQGSETSSLRPAVTPIPSGRTLG